MISKACVRSFGISLTSPALFVVPAWGIAAGLSALVTLGIGQPICLGVPEGLTVSCRSGLQQFLYGPAAN
jgi:hypothetical protein